MADYCFGIDVGGTSIKCGFFKKNGELLEKWEIPTNRTDDGAHILEEISDELKKKIDERGLKTDDIIGAGIGIPGPITEEGVVIKCANLGWGIFNVNQKLTELSGLKAVAANDANVAALGEMWKGGGQGSKDVVFVTLGTGVGGGIVVDGKVRSGCKGAAGEIGHIIVEPDETEKCGCMGHGHLEQYASATGIVNMAKKLLASTDEASKLRDINPLTAKDIFDEAKKNDALACRLVDKMCSYLALAMANIACTVDPEVFVIGGGVSKAGSIITEGVAKHYNENLLTALKDKEFRLAKLGNDAGIYGCAFLIINQEC